MKKLILPLIVAISVISCNALKEQKTITTEQKDAIEDSIPKIIPGVATIHTMRINEEIKFVIGDARFYSSSAEQKNDAAIRVGTALLHVLGPDFGITKATLIITQDTHNEVDDPKDGIKTDMKIDSLEKVMYPAK